MGTFATTFADGSSGESGRFVSEDEHTWVVTIDGGPMLVNTTSGSLITLRGDREPGPPHGHLQRPPWSFVMPGRCDIWGRPDDDWTARDTEKVDRHRWRLHLRPVDPHPAYEASAMAIVDTDVGVIEHVHLPHLHSWISLDDASETRTWLHAHRGLLHGVPPWDPPTRNT